MEQPVCPNCKSKTILHTFRTNTYVCARCGHVWVKKQSSDLKYAITKGQLGRNPCQVVDPPSPHKKIMRTLDPAEANILLEAADGSYYCPVIYTARSSGLRQAKLLGLRQRDLDPDIMLSTSVSRVLYERRGICEFKQLKIAHSHRLASTTLKLAAFLREYRLERRLPYRELGKELRLEDIVFASVAGKPMNPQA